MSAVRKNDLGGMWSARRPSDGGCAESPALSLRRTSRRKKVRYEVRRIAGLALWLQIDTKLGGVQRAARWPSPGLVLASNLRILRSEVGV